MIEKKSNYKILDLVGRGQFGRVYAAIERQSGMLVALKELNIKQLSTSNFLRELTFLVTLDHFNIVTCQALEHQANQRYLVMDYCEGGTLRDLIDRTYKLSLTQSLHLVIDVLRGLEFAHARGIIHRDIKPENILLKSSDRGYSAHIADFGIAQLNQQQSDSNVLGNTGSPAYMAPEQFYGDYSYNCDLYGLGIVLYELVVGERPFLGMPKDLLAAHLSRRAILPLNLPIVLRMAIARSLHKFPQYRFQNAAEMRQSLELVLETIEVEPIANTLPLNKSDFAVITADTQLNCDSQIVHLATASKQVYIATNKHQISRYDSGSDLAREFSESVIATLDEPIESLQSNSLGCLVTTASSLYYHAHQQDDTALLSIATFVTEQVVATVDPQGSWLAASYLTQDKTEAQLKIYRLPRGKLRYSLADCSPFDFLIALDSRHALGLSQQDRSTKFQLFNRRGSWLANFTIQVKLAAVVHNPMFAQHLLGTEVDRPNSLILIKLRQFNLRRIQLEFEAVFIKACPRGYLIGDRQGKMVILNCEGEYLSKFQASLAPEFVVTAIAVSDSQLLVASTNAAQFQLQTFAWSKIISLANQQS